MLLFWNAQFFKAAWISRQELLQSLQNPVYKQKVLGSNSVIFITIEISLFALCISLGPTQEFMGISYINEPPKFWRTISSSWTSQKYLWSLMRNNFLFQPEKYFLNFHWFLPMKAHAFFTSHCTQFALYSTGRAVPPRHSASTESVTLGRSLKVAIPSGVLLLTFSLRGSLLWGSFSKSVVLDAWAWCDWCRHLSPGVIVIAISVTVSAGFPLHYLKRALDVCNCSTVNNRYQKE